MASTVSRRQSSLILSFNSISDFSRPRLLGTLEIRAPVGRPVPVVYVSLALYCYESIHMPSVHGGFVSGHTKHATSRIIGKELLLWQRQPHLAHEDIEIMDIPFILYLPTDPANALAATLIHQHRSTIYELVGTVHCAGLESEKVHVLVNVERFDTLPAWGMFTVPKTIDVEGSDHIVNLQVTLPRTSVGPLDSVTVLVSLTGNPDWPSKCSKVRLEKIVVSIDRTVTYRLGPDTEPVSRTKKLSEQRLELNVKLPPEGFNRRIALAFPSKDQRDRAGFLDKNATSLYSPSGGFTTNSNNYSIAFEVCVRATFSKAKDISATHALTVSPYGVEEAKLIMESIEASVIEAKLYPAICTSGIRGDVTVVRGDGRGKRWSGRGLTNDPRASVDASRRPLLVE